MSLYTSIQGGRGGGGGELDEAGREVISGWQDTRNEGIWVISHLDAV